MYEHACIHRHIIIYTGTLVCLHIKHIIAYDSRAYLVVTADPVQFGSAGLVHLSNTEIREDFICRQLQFLLICSKCTVGVKPPPTELPFVTDKLEHNSKFVPRPAAERERGGSERERERVRKRN